MKSVMVVLSSILVLLCHTGIAQVNPQNGAAQVNIPLYSYSDPGNRLGLNASLVYVDGNGLKVSEMASCVGTGWVLDCGGEITRIQHGEPDDQKQNGTFDYDNGYLNYMNNYYPDGYMYSSYSPSDVIDNGGAFTPYTQFVPLAEAIPRTNPVYFKMQPQYLADREQDVFAFSFNGRQGQFMIGKNKQVVTLNDSKLKISLQEADMSASGIRNRISQFTITDEAGIQYVFSDLKLDYICTYNDVRTLNNNGVVDRNDNIDAFSPYYKPLTFGNSNAGDNLINVFLGRLPASNQFIVNKWYLSKIINPLTSKQIVFNYTTFEEDINTDKQITYPVVNNHGTVSVFWQRYKSRDKRLSSVALSNLERIDLVYSPSQRVDLANENALNQLKVSYNNSPVYSWNFGYGYMVGIDQAIKGINDTYSDAEKQWARLCLTTLQRAGVNGASEPAYQFTYNMGGDNASGGYTPVNDVIPPMFSIYQDHFGYYNGPVYTPAIPEGSRSSFYSVSTLKYILGASAFGGTYKNPVTTIAKNGIIKSITYPLGGTLTFTYEANNTSQMQLGGVRVRTTAQYDGINHSNDIIKQYNYINTDGTSSGWGGETYTYKVPVTLIAPNCQTGMVPAFTVSSVASNYLENAFLSGSIVAANFSFSAISSAITGAIASVGVSIAIAIVVELTAPNSSNDTYTMNSYHNFSTVINNPLPWGYARTEVVNLQSSGNVGKMVYTFSNPNGANDRPIDVPVPNVQNSNRPRFAYWVYGLPETITIYDNNGNKVKQTINHYNYIANTLADNNFLSKSWAATQNIYGCQMKYSATGNPPFVNQETYFPLVGHTELISTDEILYNTQQQSNVVTTNFEYDNNYQLKHKYSNNSKGEKVETFYYHPYDYSTASGAIGTMNSPNTNIVNPVISSETYINKIDGNKYMVGATSTDYNVYPNGDIKPKISYAFQNSLPVANSSLLPFSPSVVLRDPTYFKQVGLYGYDNYGNPVQTLTGGNKIMSNMYDYDGKLVVATVSNASYRDIGYSSFEAQGGKPGSWLNRAAIVSSDARTGSNSFNLSDTSNAANGYFGFGGLNNSLTYLVSLWSKNGTPCVNGGNSGQSTVNTCQGTTGWKQGATINGWTYYEVQVSDVDYIGVSGTGLVDEFRLYPVGAQMSTTTYAPLIGKTSECDASNRVTYYSYDDLGRLVKVSDDQRNVLRTYEYNYKQ